MMDYKAFSELIERGKAAGIMMRTGRWNGKNS